MKKIDPHARYFETNEWVKKNGNQVTIGLTDFAQTVLGKAIYIEFEAIGTQIKKGDKIALIETDKSTTDIFSPLSGKIILNNESLISNPNPINEDCYGKGWLVKIELNSMSEWEEMMTAEAYQSYMKIFSNKIN